MKRWHGSQGGRWQGGGWQAAVVSMMDDGVGGFGLTGSAVQAEGREEEINIHLDGVARTALTHGII